MSWSSRREAQVVAVVLTLGAIAVLDNVQLGEEAQLHNEALAMPAASVFLAA